MLMEDKGELLNIYFRRNSDYYIGQMNKYEERGKCSFSVAAFFLGIFWMAYRKMYVHILIVFGIISVETLIRETLYYINVISTSIYEIIDNLFPLILALVIGFLSNRFYIIKTKRAIQKILTENNNEEVIKGLVSKKGGTNLAAPFLLLLIFVLLFCFSF
jgi:hypothetical protein